MFDNLLERVLLPTAHNSFRNGRNQIKYLERAEEFEKESSSRDEHDVKWEELAFSNGEPQFNERLLLNSLWLLC